MLFSETRMSRRQMLRVGSLGLAGLSLPTLLRADAQRRVTGTRARADACVLIFLNGGPSQPDMWDLKPDAPLEIRGEFKPIDTSLPGVKFSEHLPRLAKHMHRSALVRSAHHLVGHAHGAAVYTMLTGHDRGDTIEITPTRPTDYPSIGSVTTFVRPPERPMVPFVSLPYATAEGINGPPQAGFFGGMLGKAHDPLLVLKDPNAPDFAVPELSLPADVGKDRLSHRKALLGAMDDRFRQASRSGVEGIRERAFTLLSSTATQRAFQLKQEPDKVREAYGRNIYGQSVLLARRLIEAGTRVVSVAWAPDANATWDTHWDMFNRLGKELLPPLDMALASLLDDLVERGMFERTLVVVMGEFGRTRRSRLSPAIRSPAAATGRFAIACSWPAAASSQGSSTAPATRPAPLRPTSRSFPPKSLPRSTRRWAFPTISNSAT